MLRLYDIEVSLVTENGDHLPQYGTQKFRNLASSYVPSITNIGFSIMIEAKIDEPATQKYPAAPWDVLSASIYIDKEEIDSDNVRHRDAAIMLGARDSVHSNTATIDGRLSRLPDGTPVLQKWMFFENGLEACFDSMCNMKGNHKSGGAGNITVQVHQVKKVRSTEMVWHPALDRQDGPPAGAALDHVIG
jgi:hypothetical protein